jgi:hypothetical protein
MLVTEETLHYSVSSVWAHTILDSSEFCVVCAKISRGNIVQSLDLDMMTEPLVVVDA